MSVTLHRHKPRPIMCTILSHTERAMRTPDRGLRRWGTLPSTLFERQLLHDVFYPLTECHSNPSKNRHLLTGFIKLLYIS